MGSTIRRGADYVARNSVHLWVSKEELKGVAEGERFVRAFYYPTDASKGSQLLRATTLIPKAAQPKWLAETEKLGDLIAVVEITRGTKPVATPPDFTDVERLQGVWLVESEEHFGQMQAAHDPEQEQLRVVIEGQTLRGCFDAPWKPITWNTEFDNETDPQAMYLKTTVNDKSKKRSVRFRLRDDRLELCFDRRNPERLPVKHRTAEGSNAVIWHLRRLYVEGDEQVPGTLQELPGTLDSPGGKTDKTISDLRLDRSNPKSVVEAYVRFAFAGKFEDAEELARGQAAKRRMSERFPPVLSVTSLEIVSCEVNQKNKPARALAFSNLVKPKEDMPDGKDPLTSQADRPLFEDRVRLVIYLIRNDVGGWVITDVDLDSDKGVERRSRQFFNGNGNESAVP